LFLLAQDTTRCSVIGILSGIYSQYVRKFPRLRIRPNATILSQSDETERSVCFVICGFNIAIIAGILLRGSRYFVAYRTSAIIALVGIALYTILVGAEASVVRAAIMAALLIVTLRFLGRPTFIPAALFTAALPPSKKMPFEHHLIRHSFDELHIEFGLKVE